MSVWRLNCPRRQITRSNSNSINNNNLTFLTSLASFVIKGFQKQRSFCLAIKLVVVLQYSVHVDRTLPFESYSHLKNPNHTSLNENYVVPCICLRAIWHMHDSCYIFQRCASHRTMHMSYRSKTYTWNNVILVKTSMIRVFLSCHIQVAWSLGKHAAN